MATELYKSELVTVTRLGAGFRDGHPRVKYQATFETVRGETQVGGVTLTLTLPRSASFDFDPADLLVRD